MDSRLALLAAVLLGMSNVAWAQPSAKTAGAQSGPPGRFLAFDVFVGGAGYQSKLPKADDAATKETVRSGGWDLGGTVRVGPRWVGITGAIGTETIANVPTYHLAAGPRFYLGEPGARWVAHALVGIVGTRDAAPSQTGPQLTLGGAWDIFILRLQYDYVRLNLAGLPKNNSRFFGGVVIPFCLRACRDKDRLCGTGCNFGV
jgi:hypothetical protein